MWVPVAAKLAANCYIQFLYFTYLSCGYLEAEAVALMECFTVKFLNVGLLRLVHVGKVARVQTFIHLRDGVIHMVTQVHHFFLQTYRPHVVTSSQAAEEEEE